MREQGQQPLLLPPLHRLLHPSANDVAEKVDEEDEAEEKEDRSENVRGGCVDEAENQIEEHKCRIASWRWGMKLTCTEAASAVGFCAFLSY